METNQKRRYALVTGASRGIGRAVALRLAGMGYHVLVNYLANAAAAEETLALIRRQGGEGELLPFDVADREAAERALGGWLEAHPDEAVEVLVNNAGIRRDGLLLWMPHEDWYGVLRTHLDGFFHVTQPLLKGMLVRKYGRIINIVSLSGIKGLPGQVNYSAAKGGLIAATRALAQEVAKKRVTVNAVAPGFIRTDMTDELSEKQRSEYLSTIPAKRFAEAEEVAKVVRWVASDEAAYISGAVLPVDGGLGMGH